MKNLHEFIKDDGVWYRIIKNISPKPALMDCWAECWEPVSEEMYEILEKTGENINE